MNHKSYTVSISRACYTAVRANLRQHTTVAEAVALQASLVCIHEGHIAASPYHNALQLLSTANAY